MTDTRKTATVVLSDGSELCFKRLENIGEANLAPALYVQLKPLLAQEAKVSGDRMLSLYTGAGGLLMSYCEIVVRLVSVKTRRKLFTLDATDEYLAGGFKTFLALPKNDKTLIDVTVATLDAAPAPELQGGTDEETAEGDEKNG